MFWFGGKDMKEAPSSSWPPGAQQRPPSRGLSAARSPAAGATTAQRLRRAGTASAGRKDAQRRARGGGPRGRGSMWGG